ncbi:MAG: putative repeat protein, partial [Acidobacteria bacterium]|nr:putative repeat protein [Acidobacteriota bacterium]
MGSDTGLAATSTFTDLLIRLVDDQGPDDEPGQKDLSFMEVDNANGPTRLAVNWGWDDTSFGNLGGNTGDGCALFDTNANGFANFSICVVADGNPAQYISIRLYRCTADSRSDRCGGPTAVTGFGSTATASVVAGSDPFGPGARANNQCSDTADCYTADTVASMTVVLSDFGATAKLINVCSYPSQEPNSDPSDCVVEPNSGFLTIVKVAGPSDTTSFAFTASAPAQNGQTSWTRIGAGTVVQSISYAAGLTYDLNEAVPDGWQLDAVSCAIQTNPTSPTGTPDAPPVQNGPASKGVQDFEIRSGLETVCTFTDYKRPKLTVNKVVEPASDLGLFNLQIDGATAGTGENVGDGGTTGAVMVTRDVQHTVGETAGTGTNLSNYVTTIGGACASDGTITLAAGDDKTCTITNQRKGSIKIIKDAEPNDLQDFTFATTGKGLSAFTLDDDQGVAGADGTYSNEILFGGLGDFELKTVTETVPPGWAVTDISCAGDEGVLIGDNSDFNPGDVSVTIDLNPGEDVVCTFVNKRVLPEFTTKVKPPYTPPAYPPSVILGTAVTDEATLTGTAGDFAGTVSFFVCALDGPTGCAEGGTPLGDPITVASASPAVVESISFRPTENGTYCFRAEFAPATGSPYSPATHTDSTYECFEVIEPGVDAAFATIPVPDVAFLGDTIKDTATIGKIAAQIPPGTVTFRLYSPSDTTC